jgi:homocysteine S-methyltransferase
MDELERELSAGGVVLLDGATGTELERRGAAMHDGAWCAMATSTHPDLLREVHRDYIDAGARVIIANTFSSSRNMLEPAGLEAHFESLNRDAVRIAREAREAEGAGEHVAVAGSISHQVPILDRDTPGQRREVPPPAVAEARFQEMAALLADAGVDLLIMEMMSDPVLAVPAIRAARATGLPVWVGFSVRAGERGELLSYSRPDLTAQEMLKQIPLEGIRVAGIMHSYVSATTPALALLRQHFDGILMAYPDSGFFRMPHWQFVDIIEPEALVDEARAWLDDGVQIVGGCCGLGIEHIQALASALR